MNIGNTQQINLHTLVQFNKFSCVFAKRWFQKHLFNLSDSVSFIWIWEQGSGHVWSNKAKIFFLVWWTFLPLIIGLTFCWIRLKNRCEAYAISVYFVCFYTLMLIWTNAAKVWSWDRAALPMRHLLRNDSGVVRTTNVCDRISLGNRF